MNFDNPIICHPSNYKKLLSYQKAEVIYDITYYFCHKYLARNDRTVDQMIQAARSGKQNIVEGSAASTTSIMRIIYAPGISVSGSLSRLR